MSLVSLSKHRTPWLAECIIHRLKNDAHTGLGASEGNHFCFGFVLSGPNWEEQSVWSTELVVGWQQAAAAAANLIFELDNRRGRFT